MAQESFYQPINNLELEAGVTYTPANIPAVADTVILQMGVRLTDNSGLNTPLRGVRMQIIDNETLPSNPKPKVPFIWIEGTELKFKAGYEYTPLDWGIVSYGQRVL